MRSTLRAPALILVGVLAAGFVALDQSGSSPSRPHSIGVGVRDGPTVPPADAVSVAWYCAEGTSVTDGRADETVIIGNLSTRSIEATVTVFSGATQPPVSVRQRIQPLGQARVPVTNLTHVAEPGVVVEVLGGQAIVEHELRGRGDVALGPCAREPARDWYFAAGTTVQGAEEWLTLFNPFGEDAIVDISFLTASGFDAPGVAQAVPVPRRTRVSYPVHSVVRREERVAIAVHARSGRIVAERLLRFDGTDARAGLAVSLGVTGSAARWRVPFGDATTGSAESISVANFDLTPAKVNVGVILDGASALEPQSVEIPGRSVDRIDLGDRVPAGAGYSVDVRVTSGPPVVVEAFGTWAAPAPVTGVATATASLTTAKRWAFAQGRLDDSGEAVLIAINVSDRPLTVQLYAYTAGDPNSPKSAPARAVPPGERAVFSLGEIGIRPDQVLVVAADGPIIAGRVVLGGGVSLSPGIPDLSA
jgi:hypothetical protein